LLLKDLGSVASYVDVINYYEEPQNGLKPWVDIKGITHWMNLPDAPKDL